MSVNDKAIFWTREWDKSADECERENGGSAVASLPANGEGEAKKVVEGDKRKPVYLSLGADSTNELAGSRGGLGTTYSA